MAATNRRISLHNVRLPGNLLKDIDIERMGKLSEDEGSFMEFLDGLDLEDLKAAQSKRQEMSDQILQTAVTNCDKEPAFEEKKAKLREKVLHLTDLKNDHSRRFGELKTLTSKGDHQSVLRELQKCLKDTEKESEQLADSYISGSSQISADEFVTQFQKKRMLYWLRKVRAEKMEELLKNIRPVPTPRSPRPSSAKPAIPPPYIAPMPNPAHSIPVSAAHHHPPYPHGPMQPHMTRPNQSMAPYPHQVPQMPMPGGHPFPHAAFAGYSGQVPPRYPTPQRHPHSYSSYPTNAY